MSLILDALRKSERTRQQSLTGQLGAGETAPPPARLAPPWTMVLGLLLLVNALALAVFFWRGDRETAAPQAATAPQTQATPYHPDVRPLSGEAASPMENSAPQAAAAAPTPGAVPPSAPVLAQNGSADLPRYDGLPPELRQTLPTLHLDVHGYAQEPSQRFVVINLQRYRIGDSVAGNLKVVDIVPQGVILESNGTRFLLPP